MTKIKRISPKFEAQIDKIHRYIDIDDCNRQLTLTPQFLWHKIDSDKEKGYSDQFKRNKNGLYNVYSPK